MKVLGVIPARYGSTRFPGKPLADINGKSMIRRVYEQTLQVKNLDRIVVATDDSTIFDHVKGFGGDVIMTSPKHPNGTSRCHEALEMIKIGENQNFDLVVNIQGDEPFINPDQIESVVHLFENAGIEIGTLAKKIDQKNELFNPNVVKVIYSQNGIALYFSRSPLPYLRDFPEKDWVNNFDYFKHIGIYGYKAEILKKLVSLKPGKLEEAEKLEQLRWLENGFRIAVGVTQFESIAVDTPDDLLKFTNRS